MLGDRLPQRRHARQRRVLVVPGPQRRRGRFDHLGRPVVVGEALAEVDRPVRSASADISVKIVVPKPASREAITAGA